MRHIFLIIVLLSSSLFAQTNEKPKAYLFDEFGKISDAEIKERTLKLREEIASKAWSKSPHRAYIISYSEKGISIKKTNKLIRDVLYHNCYDCMGWNTGIVWVNGGEKEEQKTKFWIIPYGARLSWDSENEKTLPKANKIDGFGEVGEFYYMHSFKKLVKAMLSDVESKGIVLHFPSESNSNNSDYFRTMKKTMLDSPLVVDNNLQDRITFKIGTVRKSRRSQLWLVPKGVEEPNLETNDLFR